MSLDVSIDDHVIHFEAAVANLRNPRVDFQLRIPESRMSVIDVHVGHDEAQLDDAVVPSNSQFQ